MQPRSPSDPVGILAALPRELGSLPARATARRAAQGLELLELDLDGHAALACIAGVGKVRAARAAAILIGEGARGGLLVVGTCGGLRRRLVPGTLVHCATAVQVDLAVREGREVRPDEELRAAWERVAPGEQGWFLTADRPVLSWWRRGRLARAFAGACVADMETAAAAHVASAAGVPWAGLRAVTDGAGALGGLSFAIHYPTLAGRAADTVPDLLAALGREGRFVPPRAPP